MLLNLKFLRKESGISQKRLADAIDVSQQSINQYENHAVEPDISTLSQMADFFDTSIDFIVGRTDSREPPGNKPDKRLNRDEALLIEKYRRLNPEEKRSLQKLLDTLLDMLSGVLK